MCMVEVSGDYATVLAESRPMARKAHRCSECRRQITPGEQYINERLLCDGGVMTHKVCAHCEVVRDWLGKECGGWLYGGLEEDIREHAYEGYPMDVRRLAVGMGWKWRTPKGRMLPVPKLPLTTRQRMAGAPPTFPQAQ